MAEITSKQPDVVFFPYLDDKSPDRDMAERLQAGRFGSVILAAYLGCEENILPELEAYVNSNEGRITARHISEERLKTEAAPEDEYVPICECCGGVMSITLEPQGIPSPETYSNNNICPIPNKMQYLNEPTEIAHRFFTDAPNIAWLMGNAPQEVTFAFNTPDSAFTWSETGRYVRGQYYNLFAATYNLSLSGQDWRSQYVNLHAIDAFGSLASHRKLTDGLGDRLVSSSLEVDATSTAVIGHDLSDSNPYINLLRPLEHRLRILNIALSAGRAGSYEAETMPHGALSIASSLYSRMIEDGPHSLPRAVSEIPQTELKIQQAAFLIATFLSETFPLPRGARLQSDFREKFNSYIPILLDRPKLIDKVNGLYEQAVETAPENEGFARATLVQKLEKLLDFEVTKGV